MCCGIYSRVAWNLYLHPANQILAGRHTAELLRAEAQADQCAVWIAQLVILNFCISTPKNVARFLAATFVCACSDYTDVYRK